MRSSPLEEMAPAARSAAYLSPLAYAQDLVNRALQGTSLLNPRSDLAVLLLMGVLFLLPWVKLHQRSRRLGY